jgi:hypothetical protein
LLTVIEGLGLEDFGEAQAQALVEHLDEDGNGNITFDGQNAGFRLVPSSGSDTTSCVGVLSAEFLHWWTTNTDDASIVEGLSMQVLKADWVEPFQYLYYLFENPDWFKFMGRKGLPLVLAGKIMVSIINVAIVVSTFAFCVESIPGEYSPDPHKNPGGLADAKDMDDIWTGLEYGCVVLFTLDFLIRSVAGTVIGRWREFFHPWDMDYMNLVDLLAVVPFYLRLIWPDMVDLRFIRVIRLARILQLGGPLLSGTGKLIKQLVINTLPALALPLYLMMLYLIIFGAIALYTEASFTYVCTLADGTRIENDPNSGKVDPNGLGSFGAALDSPNMNCLSMNLCRCARCEDDPESTQAGVNPSWPDTCQGVLTYVSSDGVERSSEVFASIGDSMWWCVQTFTTVGYGDINPLTPIGQMFGAIVMFTGVFFLSMPLTVVGQAFVKQVRN